MKNLSRKVVNGIVAGAAATVPMTALMLVWHANLPDGEKYPLPPREIFDEIAERARLDRDLSESGKIELSLAGHFVYGAGCGAIYSILFHKPTLANGAVFGLGVWTISYLGWLPALKILRPATEHPLRRNALMIAAHLIWGATVGGFSQARSANEE